MHTHLARNMAQHYVAVFQLDIVVLPQRHPRTLEVGLLEQ